MLKVLVNAYAVSPNWGSEPGMGWNWIINLARYCELFIITEGQWREEIENSISDALNNGTDKSGHLSKEQASNLHFFYNPIPEKIRRMCWNQGDWRFYYYYKKWQDSTLEIARKIISQNEIDLIHQLNMIGYREPGMLWKITDRPYVWGPFGGLELMNESYLQNENLKTRLLSKLKNRINDWQRKHQNRFRKVLHRADGICCATRGVYNYVISNYRKDAFLINETGCYVNNNEIGISTKDKQTFDVIWVGKFDFRKQLGVAIYAMNNLKKYPDIHLHIYGDGYAEDTNKYHNLCNTLELTNNIHWHGKVPNDEIQRKMRESDILLFTSIMEGTPHVVMEAMGNNLPIICFDTCGQGDCVDEKCGIKIQLSNPTKSANDFASAILTLYTDTNKLLTLKRGCRTRQKELSWENKISTMLQVYNQAIDHYNNSKK